jgi:hypothetical protein
LICEPRAASDQAIIGLDTRGRPADAAGENPGSALNKTCVRPLNGAEGEPTAQAQVETAHRRRRACRKGLWQWAN